MYQTIRIAALVVFIVHTAAAQTISFKPQTVEAGGQRLDVEMGELRVPENRANPKSRTITLRLARLKSTSAKPGYPIVYLAGGPGGSGIGAARSSRLPLFLALREFGDVIALDQRGTGASEPDMQCRGEFIAPMNEPLDRAKAGAILARAIKTCADKLRVNGVDVDAYNTRSSAADLEDLRKALGAEKLVLWGISYGTHLAIATLRDYGPHVDRVILAGIEGPDETYKLPSDQQELLERIALMAPGDLLVSVKNVLRELEKSPRTVSLTHPLNGQTANVTVGPLDFQIVLAQMLTGPDSFAVMPDFVTRVEGGDWTALALAAASVRMIEGQSIMSVAMDCASGLTAERRATIAEEAKRTLLADAINIPFPEVCAGVKVPDAGNAFRAPLKSAVPALLISGTLDGRTRPRQAEALRLGMPNAQHLIIEGAGHSDPLFLSSPKILEAMKAFLGGERLRERVIALPPPKLVPVRTLAAVSDDVLARHVGAYRIDEKSTRRVVKAGSVLYTVREGSTPFAIRPMSETDFFYESSGAWIHFEVDGDGKVTAMVFHTDDGKEARAPRM